MKVGIISINAHTKVLNFASPLHTYAFQQFLTREGIDNIIIDYKPCYMKAFDVRHPYDWHVEHPDADPEKQAKLLAKWKTLYDDREKRFDRLQEFIDEKYVATPVLYNQDLLDTEDPGCDIYMAVTDIIWKYNPVNGFDRGFLLNSKCMEGKGTIAYAASRGASKYTEEQNEQFRGYIQNIDYITAREKSLMKHVNDQQLTPASLVIDPILLMDADFYRDMEIKPKEEKYVLCYTVMENKTGVLKAAFQYAQEHGLTLVDISDDATILYDHEGLPRTTYYDIGVEEWLGFMDHAEVIFTNSFHCVCFSMLFHKDFYAGPRGGDKVTWILDLFEIKGRRLKKDGSLPNGKINWERTDSRLAEYRGISRKYILTAIKNLEFRQNHPTLGKLRMKLIKPKGIEGAVAKHKEAAKKK